MTIRYTRDHIWVRMDGDAATLGISRYAQDQLGDVAIVTLPSIGAKADQNTTLGVIESVKTASEFFAPIGGEVVEVNGELESSPELLNDDALGSGWMVKLRPRNEGELDGLMDETEYTEFVKQLLR